MVVDTMPERPVSGGEPFVDNDTDKVTEAYKPTHRLTGKQTPPKPVRAIVAQLDKIADTKEIRLENNENKEENKEWSQS
eukprot:1989135-Amphidinium_carterae.1